MNNSFAKTLLKLITFNHNQKSQPNQIQEKYQKRIVKKATEQISYTYQALAIEGTICSVLHKSNNK